MGKDLSIIILSFNTKEITKNCLDSVIKSLLQATISYEIIVLDNGSIDGSTEFLKETAKSNPMIRIIESKENLGFAKANNQAAKKAEGRYILFLNSDVFINKISFKEIIDYLDCHKAIGALTVKIRLENGEIDPASHRGFPTLWRSFCYFIGLEKFFGKVPFLKKIFGGYHLLNNDFNSVHEIDSPSGAFFLLKKEIFQRLSGFDEKFFMYGEDLDLAYRIKKLDYKIIYYPKWLVTHLKYQSGLKKDNEKVKKAIKNHFYQAMKLFFDKHYAKNYPKAINNLIHFLIYVKEKIL